MNKLEQLQEAIDAIPDEYNIVRKVMTNLLNQGALQTLRDYSLGALDMARHLTSEENLLDSLRLVRGVTEMRINEYLIAQGFGVDSELTLAAFFLGVEDGKKSGDELGVGMTYEDLDCQRAYDVGTRVGTTLKLLEN